MAINGATSRCQRAYHQCLPNIWAFYLFRSPPNAVCHTGCLLASFHRQCCNPGCPRAPKTIRAPASGQHRDHTEEEVVSQQWSARSSSTHSPALSATCIYLLRGQKVANYHGKGNSTLSRKDCDLVLLSCTSGTADCARAVKTTCAWIWQFSLGDI